MKKSLKQQMCDIEKKGMVFPLLPSSFKWIGVLISILAIVVMALVKYNELELMELYKDIAMHVILIGLFLMALASEKNEDERVQRLRYRAFAFSFVLITFILLLMPFISLVIDGLTEKLPLKWEQQSFFFIMSYYLFFYLAYFEIFKRSL